MRDLPSDKPKISGQHVLIALELFTILEYGKGKEAAARVVRAVVHEYLRNELDAARQEATRTPDDEKDEKRRVAAGVLDALRGCCKRDKGPVIMAEVNDSNYDLGIH